MSIGFTGSPLDRADQLRLDPAAVAALRADPVARMLRFDWLDPVLGEDDHLVWDAVGDGELLFLGLDDGMARFAPMPDLPPGTVRGWSVFHLLARMSDADAAVWASARSLIEWHNRNRHCTLCGARSLIVRAGWARRCPDCAAEHFPRVDPVVIMLAEHDGRVLVGRGHQYPPGRYSALAGFVEPGESIEEAVARELAEEAGVATLAVHYVASQPWPFPSSLMMACIASAASDALRLDPAEIEDAMWVDAGEVRAALAGDPGARFQAPPRFAIAHSLLDHWASGGLAPRAPAA